MSANLTTLQYELMKLIIFRHKPGKFRGGNEKCGRMLLHRLPCVPLQRLLTMLADHLSVSVLTAGTL